MRFSYPGGDPRRFSEFGVLRAEIDKLAQTSQPPLDWAQIDICARSLFEQNGVDLLSACYFSLARTHIYGLKGFTESCELISRLISQHWDDAFWPSEPQARIEALDWFNMRIGHLIRKQTFGVEQLPLLKRAGKALENIADKLQQVPLKKLSRVENLYYFVQNVVDTLEKTQPGAMLPPLSAPAVRQVINEPMLQPVPVRQWSGWVFFGLGVLCSAVAIGLYHYMQAQYQNAVVKVTGPSFEWFAAGSPATPDDLGLQGQTNRILRGSEDILEQYQQQLTSLTRFSPRSPWLYGEHVLRASRQWWPNVQKQQLLTDFWSQQLHSQAAYPIKIDGYYRIQGLLDELIGELDKASRQDKYITVTYLRTMLQRMQNVQQSSIPIEEWLRQAEELKKKGQPLPSDMQRQLDQLLQTISARYYLAGADVNNPVEKEDSRFLR